MKLSRDEMEEGWKFLKPKIEAWSAGSRAWSQAIAADFIADLAVEFGLPAEKRDVFCALLSCKGLGMNPSQLEQAMGWTGKSADGASKKTMLFASLGLPAPAGPPPPPPSMPAE